MKTSAQSFKTSRQGFETFAKSFENFGPEFSKLPGRALKLSPCGPPPKPASRARDFKTRLQGCFSVAAVLLLGPGGRFSGFAQGWAVFPQPQCYFWARAADFQALPGTGSFFRCRSATFGLGRPISRLRPKLGRFSVAAVLLLGPGGRFPRFAQNWLAQGPFIFKIAQ